MTLGRNRHGQPLAVTEKGETVRIIFIPEGMDTGGWWRMMIAMLEVAGTKCEAPLKVRVNTLTTKKIEKRLEEGYESSPVLLCYANYISGIRVSLKVKRAKSFADAVKQSSG